MTNAEIKKQLRDYAIVTGIISLLFVGLWFLALYSKPFWESSLKNEVCSVLEKSMPGKVFVSDAVKLNSPLSVSAAVFRLQPVQGGVTYNYAAIARIATVCGPKAAVFVHTKGAPSAEFVNFVLANKKSEKLLSATSQVSYWEKKLGTVFNGLE